MLFIPAGRKITLAVIYLGQTKTDASNTVQYLGITLDAKLSFQGHIGDIRARASKLIPRMRALLRIRSDCTKDTAKMLYKRVVLPGLLYGAEIWSDRASKTVIKKQLLIVQRIFLRSVVSAYSTTSTQALLVLAGITPLHIEAEKRAWSYADKQTESAETRIRQR